MNITIIGAGRVAWSLIPALQSTSAKVHQLISRNTNRRALFLNEYKIQYSHNSFSDLRPDTDLVILTVPDAQVASVAEALKPFSQNPKTIIAHTSGSVSIKALKSWGEHAGVFYPMQTFTLEKATPYDGVPLFLEGNERVLQILEPLAKAMTSQVYTLDSEARAKLHLGAVMVCNFTNLLYTYADEMISGVDIKAYEPLICGHLENVFSLGPRQSQTGPAARGDQPTIKRHVDMLEDKPEVAALYAMMSEQIRLMLDE